ncbi:MAG TPA: tetratricopeptide repeat protein [Bacteroidetes bacterium]|nr:tetratricopeptide repeat protein [Bacteroidota bacterium]
MKRKSNKKDLGNANYKNWITNKRFHLLVIFVLAIILYANTLWNDYAQDDAIVITDNMFTKQGIKGIPGFLTNDTFYGFFKKKGKAKLVSGGRYRPLSPITFAIEWQFFGKNPAVSHLINVLLFALLGIVLYKFLLLLFMNVENDKLKYLVPFFTSLIFIAHPIHTEVVANIKGRDELFVLLFSLLAVIFSIKWFKTKQIKFQFYVFLMFLLALFSKENSITFLAIVPLVFYMFFYKNTKSYFKILTPFLIATVLFLIARIMVLGLDFGAAPMEMMNNPFVKIEGSKYVPFSFGEKAATIIFTLGKYIQLLIFPHPLTNDYYPRQIAIMSFADWKVILSLLVYIGLIYYVIRNFKKEKVISFGILFYLITLSIVSNIVFPVGTNMSERFLFMPSLGFSLIFGYLLYLIYDKKRNLSNFLLVFILLLYSIKTISRNAVWKNDFTLFTTDVKISNNSAKALNAAAGSLVDAAYKEKNRSKRERMLKEAKTYLEKALKIHPNYKNAWLILGNTNYFLKNYEDAIRDFKQALKLDPSYEDANKNLAIAYRDAGKYYGEKKKDLSNAIKYLNEAFKMTPDDYETVRLLGVAYAVSGNNEKAIFYFSKAVELEPDNAGAYKNLGNAYFNSGNPEKGKFYHDKARELDPEIFNKN